VAARIICRITRRVRAGDHTIVLATPFAGDLHPLDDATPLVYHDGAYTHLPPSAGDEILAVKFFKLDEVAALSDGELVSPPMLRRIVEDLRSDRTYPLEIVRSVV